MIRLRSSTGGQHFADAEPRLLACDWPYCPNAVRPEDAAANGWRTGLGTLRGEVRMLDLCAKHVERLTAG